MGKANLEELDQMVRGAISTEMGEDLDEDIDAKALNLVSHRYREVGGLRIVANASRDRQFDPEAKARYNKLGRYRADAALLGERHKKEGIEDIARLPLETWNTICDRVQLYRFTPNKGYIHISTGALLKEVAVEQDRLFTLSENARTEGIRFGIGSISFVLGVASAIGAAVLASPWMLVGIPAVVVFGTASGAVVGTKPVDPNTIRYWNERRDVHFESALKTVIANHQKNGTLLSLLLPGFKEPEESDVWMRIRLPDPPPEVADKLVSLERTALPIHIAASAEAITLVDDLATLVLTKKNVAAVSESLPSSCPIVYQTEGTAVAIVDQFGDFEIERSVLTEVVNSVHLI